MDDEYDEFGNYVGSELAPVSEDEIEEHVNHVSLKETDRNIVDNVLGIDENGMDMEGKSKCDFNTSRRFLIH